MFNEDTTPDNDPAWDERAPELTEAGEAELRRIDPEYERLAALDPVAFVP